MPMPHRSLATAALLVLLAGCAGPAKPPAEPAAPLPAPPAPEPQGEPAPVPAAPQRPATPAEAAQSAKIAKAAVDLLQAGKEDEARAELERALALDGSNGLAQSLLRQITTDLAEVGRESYAYTIKPGETLSLIAQRHLGDVYAFYLLARFNGIKVPRQISAGQALRIPGRSAPAEPPQRAPAPPRQAAAAPPPAPAPLPAPAPAPVPERADRAEAPPAPPAASPAPPVPPAPPPAPAAPPPPPEPPPGELALRNAEKADKAGQLDRAFGEFQRAATLGYTDAQLRRSLVDGFGKAARQAFARQDLAGAIRQWERVLQLDPGNPTASAERQRAVDLKKRADELK